MLPIIVEDVDRPRTGSAVSAQGQVGRSNRLAYAYLTYKKIRHYEIADKRLRAIKKSTEFDRFKIAMRDLQIREREIFWVRRNVYAVVGYDMYLKILMKQLLNSRVRPSSRALIQRWSFR